MVSVLQHYKCYDVLGEFGRDRFFFFFPPKVFLEDQFESKEAKILGAETFCNPVDKEGEGIVDETAHLTCYEIENSGSSFFSFFSPVRHVQVDNQFGLQEFIVAGARNLCIPSEKRVPPEDFVASDLEIDHFKCYTIVDFDRFFFPLKVDLADQFEDKRTVLLAPKLLCNPVNKEGEGILDEEGHLTCYDIFDERERFFFIGVRNQIDDPLGLLLGKPEFLCVPSMKFENGSG